MYLMRSVRHSATRGSSAGLLHTVYFLLLSSLFPRLLSLSSHPPRYTSRLAFGLFTSSHLYSGNRFLSFLFTAFGSSGFFHFDDQSPDLWTTSNDILPAVGEKSEGKHPRGGCLNIDTVADLQSVDNAEGRGYGAIHR